MMEEGVDTIFGYPGGMVTDLFDELYKQDDIHLVLPRHEQGLIHEAEGYARATGKPGVCLVTRRTGSPPILLQDSQMRILTAFRLFALPVRCHFR